MENINNILELFKPTKKQTLIKFFGVATLLLGIATLIITFILGERHLNTIEELLLLFLGFWLLSYGVFATITKRGIWSLYLPTICLLILFSLPCITAALTYKFKEWILILSTCGAVLISIVLFIIFLYFVVTKPMKIKNNFINQYRDYFNSKPLLTENGEVCGIELTNKNGDVATIIPITYNNNGVILEKNLNGSLIYVTHKSFVERYSAKHFAYNFLLTLERDKK